MAMESTTILGTESLEGEKAAETIVSFILLEIKKRCPEIFTKIYSSAGGIAYDESVTRRYLTESILCKLSISEDNGSSFEEAELLKSLKDEDFTIELPEHGHHIKLKYTKPFSNGSYYGFTIYLYTLKEGSLPKY